MTPPKYLGWLADLSREPGYPNKQGFASLRPLAPTQSIFNRLLPIQISPNDKKGSSQSYYPIEEGPHCVVGSERVIEPCRAPRQFVPESNPGSNYV